MSAPYRGRGAIPKGKHAGSQAECLQAGRVLKWGEEAVDPRLLAQERLPDLDRLQGKSNSMVQRARRIRKLQAEAQVTLRSANASEKRKKAAQKQIDQLEADFQKLRAAVPKMKATIAEAEERHRRYAKLVRKIEREREEEESRRRRAERKTKKKKRRE